MKRSTGIIVTAVLAVALAALLMVFVVRVAQTPGGKVKLGTDLFELGPPATVKQQIRTGGPLVFADPNRRGKVIVVALVAPKDTVVAFNANLGTGCRLEVARPAKTLRNSCTGQAVDPATVTTPHYRVFTHKGRLEVDLNRTVS